MKKIKFLMCIALHFFATSLRAKNAEEVLTHRTTLEDFPRINGEIDFSKIEEVAFKTAEKTQFVGRFGIVIAHIEDLVQAPEFIGFRPVLVIGKLTYRREGNVYVCHIQWEKVCLVTPAFNKVKRLDKGLKSRFNHLGTEITKDFLMSAKGDIPTFIKNVKELFNAPVATEADLTDKEREKLNNVTNNTMKDKLLTEADGSKPIGRNTARPLSNLDEHKKTYGAPNSDSEHKKNERAGASNAQASTSREAESREAAKSGDTESTPLKESEKPKMGNASVIGSSGVDSTQSDSITLKISDSGVGNRTNPNVESNNESKNGERAGDSRNPGNNSGATARGGSGSDAESTRNATGRSTSGARGSGHDESRNSNSRNLGSNETGASGGGSGTGADSTRNATGRSTSGANSDGTAESGNRGSRNPGSNDTGASGGGTGTGADSTRNATGRSTSGVDGGETVDRNGNSNGTSPTRSNATNESNRYNRPVVNVHHVDGSTGRANSTGQAQDSARQAYQYGYDQSLGNDQEQRRSVNAPLSSNARSTSSTEESNPLSDFTSGTGVRSEDYMGSTTEGCGIRVDLNQLRAFQQERLVVRRNGREERSECKDGNITYTVHKDYNHPYEVDLAANKAYPTYSYYYLDGTSRRKDVHITGRVKEKDLNNPVVLHETEEGCNVKEEYGRDSTTMVKCKRKFYIKHSGEKEFATSTCLETNIKARVIYTNEGCPVAHDLSAKRSFVQHRRVYQFPEDQAPTEYSRCEPENRQPIPHETKLCDPEVENGKCFERKRVEVKVNGQNIVISPCARISVNGTPLEKEYENSYSHLSYKSHPYMRKYYTFNNQKHYVTGSEVDLSTVFPHQKRILSYENRDDLRRSVPLEQTYFKGIHGHEVDVKIESGAPIDYEKTRETEVRSEGEPTYDGCYKVTKRAVYLKYKRPNNTFYYEKQKDEEPLREYVCQTEYIYDDKIVKTNIKYLISHGRRRVSTGIMNDTWVYDNLPMEISFTSKKTVDEVKQMKFKDELGGELVRSLIKNIVVIYQHEKTVHSISKLNGREILSSKTLVSRQTFDETIVVGGLQ